MTSNSWSDEPASTRAEVLGWLAFLMFVGAVYSLRQMLNRSARDR